MFRIPDLFPEMALGADAATVRPARVRPVRGRSVVHTWLRGCQGLPRRPLKRTNPAWPVRVRWSTWRRFDPSSSPSASTVHNYLIIKDI